MTTKTISKSAWQRRNDRGPHLAWLPSGPDPEQDAPIKFVVPDLSALLRSGNLPEAMNVTATLMSAHEEGPNGYMRDSVQTAMLHGGDAQETIAKAITVARDLTHHLVAEMLVEPKVTAQEVFDGILPPLDVQMLAEFATRERNVDAAGNRLPIVVPYEERWYTFRYERSGAEGTDPGGENGAAAVGDVSESDGGAL